jgi:hypothetical protein
MATQRLLEALPDVPVLKIVYSSSSSVYGDAESYPTAETARPRPMSPYGVTKLAAEHLCELYRSNFGTPTASLRLFSVYGPGQRPDMAFSRLIRAALRGDSFPLFGDGRPQYQANTTLVMGAQDPQSAEEAAVLADTARGIATGPQLVTRVISTTGATRNEQEVAAAINVQALGNSGVLTLSVTDPNRQVAVKLANGLTAGVVNTRVALIENGLASSLRGLAQQEASTDAQIRKLNTRIQTVPPGRTCRGSPGSCR